MRAATRSDRGPASSGRRRRDLVRLGERAADSLALIGPRRLPEQQSADVAPEREGDVHKEKTDHDGGARVPCCDR